MKPIYSCTAAMLTILAGVSFFRPHVVKAGADSTTTRQGATVPAIPPGSKMRFASSFAGRRPIRTDLKMHLAGNYCKLPLSFEANYGQTDGRVKFLSRGRGYSLFLTGNEAVLSLQKSADRALSGSQSDLVGRLASERVAQAPLFGVAGLPDVVSLFRPKTGLDKPVEKPWDREAGPAPPFSSPRSADSGESSAVLRMRLVGASASTTLTGEGELPGKSNYFIGNDPKKWRTNLPTYAKVKYKDIYPGVDLIYYGNQRQLEYDFVVSPGADPRQIALAVDNVVALPSRWRNAGATSTLQIDGAGDLVVGAQEGKVVFHKPVVYQPSVSHAQRATDVVEGAYVLKGNRVTFEVASYDKTRPLVIDPTLAYSTYLGGGGDDEALGIAVDASGNAYVAGVTDSTNFPTTPGALQPACDKCSSTSDAFVTKLNQDGSALIYSTFLGGTNTTGSGSIAVDAAGNAYITGATQSSDFPTTASAFQTSYAGGDCSSLNEQSCPDAFVTKLNSTGSGLVYSTYLAGPGGAVGEGVAIDSSGDAYIVGTTTSTSFPTTPGAFQTTAGGGYDVFVSKLTADGAALVYSTYLGGTGYDAGPAIAVDASKNVYVAGATASTNFPITAGAFDTQLGSASDDAFVTKLSADGKTLIYSTYLGGSAPLGSQSFGAGIAVDSSGEAYVAGNTNSNDFPVTSGAFQTTFEGGLDGFVTKLNASGSTLVYSTYLGGTNSSLIFGTVAGSIAVDSAGKAYVTGSTVSTTFPVLNPIQAAFAGGTCTNGGVQPCRDAFATELNVTGSSLIFSTYLGGTGDEQGLGITLDAFGNIYLTGSTASVDFPVVTGGFQTLFGGGTCGIPGDLFPCPDAFIAKISPANVPGIALDPHSLVFGSQNVATPSAPRIVTLTNTGSAVLALDSITITGPDREDFAETNTCGASLALGANCAISVTFTPTEAGTRTGEISIADNAAGDPQQVSLQGTGTGGSPVVGLKPSHAISYPPQKVGTTSEPRTVHLANLGNAPLNIMTIAVSANFAQTNNCPATLAPAARCEVRVSFRPAATGTLTGELTFTDNAQGSPQMISLTGTGEGRPVVKLTPASVTFASQPVGTRSVGQRLTITNVGTGSLLIEDVHVRHREDFAVQNSCDRKGASIAPGASCTITVMFTPIEDGILYGDVEVYDNAPGSPQVVALIGTGTGKHDHR